MKNIHLLSTSQPSRLHFDNKLFLSPNYQDSKTINSIVEGRNIYITNDEEIKDGDSVILKSGRLTKAETRYGTLGFKTIDGIAFLYFQEGSKKIILTTDQDLINEGVQAIDDEFLEWFVKNPSCEEVEVVKDYNYGNLEHFDYKIIIPKEEIYFKFTGELDGLPTSSDVINYLLNAFKVPKEYFGKEEPKQETLEEKHIGHTINEFDKTYIEGFYNGAKWQQERSYSEEEVIHIVQRLMYDVHCGDITDTDFIVDFKISPIKWFEQFKKKSV